MSETEGYSGSETTEGGYESDVGDTTDTGDTTLDAGDSTSAGDAPLTEETDTELTEETDTELTEETDTERTEEEEAVEEEVEEAEKETEEEIEEKTATETTENTESEKDYYTSYKERMDHTPSTDSELGSWEGDRGESKFCPNEETEDGAAAKAKLAEYGMDGVEYKNAEPNFAQCCEAEVKIDNMTAERENYKNADGETQYGNFYQADEKCAELWNQEGRDGRKDWTASDVRDWRRDEAHKCSWHECCDTSTMQLVPTEIHSLHRHSGGVAECKKRDNTVESGDEFDE